MTWGTRIRTAPISNEAAYALVERLEKDVRVLLEMADHPSTSAAEKDRLTAKASGVSLALSKVREVLPGRGLRHPHRVDL